MVAHTDDYDSMEISSKSIERISWKSDAQCSLLPPLQNGMTLCQKPALAGADTGREKSSNVTCAVNAGHLSMIRTGSVAIGCRTEEPTHRSSKTSSVLHIPASVVSCVLCTSNFSCPALSVGGWLLGDDREDSTALNCIFLDTSARSRPMPRRFTSSEASVWEDGNCEL